MDIIRLLQCNAWKGANLAILDAESTNLVQRIEQQTCHQQLASQIMYNVHVHGISNHGYLLFKMFSNILASAVV